MAITDKPAAVTKTPTPHRPHRNTYATAATAVNRFAGTLVSLTRMVDIEAHQTIMAVTLAA
jgi:hypothetical protein